MELLRELARFSLHRWSNPFPKDVREAAKIFFADTSACMILGCKTPAVKISAAYVRQNAGQGDYSVVGSTMKTTLEGAATVNGVAAHADDYDDTLLSMKGHPSVVLLPVVLALGEQLHSPGLDLLKAYSLGLDVCAAIGTGMSDGSFRRTWHNTSVIGVFGATAAAGVMLGLTEDQLTYALGIAASETGGIMANFGTMTKPLHAGRTAARGIMCAKLAQLGFDSNPNALSGLAVAVAGGIDEAAMLGYLHSGKHALLDPGLGMKVYPSCKATHNSIDATLDIIHEQGLSADDIERIDILHQAFVENLLIYPNAKTMLEGKFSMPYNIALAAVYGDVSLKDFEGAEITDPKVLAMMQRVHPRVEPELTGGVYMVPRGDAMAVIETKDGRRFEKRVNYATGDTMRPCSRERRRRKWASCMEDNIRPECVEPLLDFLEGVDGISDAGEFFQAVNAAVKTTAL